MYLAHHKTGFDRYQSTHMLDGQTVVKQLRSKKEDARFSILIPTWNNLPYLKLCIDSILRNAHFRHQIIVHINGGTDGTLEWVQSREELDYTWSKENIGICYALNIAASLAYTDYIVYMNDDMYVCPDWDLAWYREIQKIGHPYFFFSATAIEPFASSNNCVIVQDYGTQIENFREEALLQGYGSLQKSDWQGATWPPNIVHKDCWDLVGGYSTEFSPGMYSDPDFSMKLWVAGVRLFRGLGNSRVYHFGSKSVGRISKNKGYYTFIAKWGMTPGTLTRQFLRSGTPWTGPLPSAPIGRKLAWKNAMKRVLTALKRVDRG